MSDDKAYEKVKDMAKLVFLSGRISEVHEKNLKSYPFVFFNGVKSVEIKYDLSHHPEDLGPKEEPKKPGEYYDKILDAMKMKSEAYVAFYLTIEDGAEQDHPEKRFEAIRNAIHGLFWKDITVKVYFNGKIAYES